MLQNIYFLFCYFLSSTILEDIQSFYNNFPGTKEFCWIENTKHRFESYSYFQDNPEKKL